jgi:hypothetical protein
MNTFTRCSQVLFHIKQRQQPQIMMYCQLGTSHNSTYYTYTNSSIYDAENIAISPLLCPGFTGDISNELTAAWQRRIMKAL